MKEIFTGLYVCGSIFLALALLGIVLGKWLKHARTNTEAWHELWQARVRRAELEAELEELGKEQNGN